MDFSKLEVATKEVRKLARFTFGENVRIPGVEGRLWIDVVCADRKNKKYFNGMLKSDRRRQRRIQRGNLRTEDLDEQFERSLVLFPLHVCKAWGVVNDGEYVEAPYTADECEAVLRKIAQSDYESVDDLIDFATNTANFTEDVDAGGDDGGLGKN